MTFRILATAALLALSPTLALAQGCNGSHLKEQVSSCADGFAWDSATGTCVEQVTS